MYSATFHQDPGLLAVKLACEACFFCNAFPVSHLFSYLCLLSKLRSASPLLSAFLCQPSLLQSAWNLIYVWINIVEYGLQTHLLLESRSWKSQLSICIQLSIYSEANKSQYRIPQGLLEFFFPVLPAQISDEGLDFFWTVSYRLNSERILYCFLLSHLW